MGSENALDSNIAVVNFLVPILDKASDEEVEKVCTKFGISKNKFSRIRLTDPGLSSLQVAVGDVVKIKRKSWVTQEETLYYRWVVP
ncbi:MAG TPA: DNA-directed RNA polymerase subunit RpoH/Rpb5 C-terminal domain-containing protein [Candidatus Norongarragalinales archaeon]|nr:DNA-directed RNA polymerase subunit RpoH/Rpb5 C-terminal domain-containing protein [Candidatus Norongarragalinales archaeon]